VDLKTKIVDARIFDGDTTHPGGWGTVLVGAMRLGGKAITGGPDARTFRSAFFAIDVTTPGAPKLLWEVSDPNLNYTTSYPAIIRTGAKDAVGSWYVIFGSGPTTFEGDGAATGYVYVRNLKYGTSEVTTPFTFAVGTNPIFMASPITVDLGLDYGVDLAYIGASYKESGTWKGKIVRIKTDNADPNSWTTSDFITFDQPITDAPTAALDPFGRLWLFWGTGRYLSDGDKTDTSTQRLYGAWDPLTLAISGTSTYLNNVTGVSVYEQGYMDTSGNTFAAYLAAKRNEYVRTTDRKYGWYLNLPAGERCFNKPTIMGDIVLVPTFLPSSDICGFGGDSYLNALYYETGTAYQESVIGTGGTPIVVGGEPRDEIFKKIGLGIGMPTNVVIHAGREQGVKGMVQLGTGVVKEVEINPASNPQSKVIFWREKAE
jgi:type IV pilus assembly protein PilY1